MIHTADVVIVGGGIMGASTAYHLARRGCRVIVLEGAEFPGLGSTGLNAGGVRYQFSTAVNIRLSQLSIGMMESFPAEMGQEVELNRCGYLFLLDNPGDVARFRANVALQNDLGVPSEILDEAAIGALAPEFVLDDIVGGSWCPLDGLVDPSGLLHGYISRARQLGVTIHTNTPATGMDVAGGAVRSVRSGGDTFQCDTVVIAAGPWSRQVGALAGVDLPIDPVRRQIAVTTPIAGLRNDFPFVIDFSRALYFHRESGGVLTGMSNRDEKPGFVTSVDEEWRFHHLQNAMERLPLLQDAELAAEWAGLYEITPDDQPILGRLTQVDGLHVCAGFSGHGLMHGPGAGLLMAEEILDGRAHTVDIDALRYERFAGSTSDTAEYNVV